MNRLSREKRKMILSMLVEGSSMRSVTRVVGCSINTVSKLLVDAGEVCGAYHHETVRNVRARHVQCDEIWAFCYAKTRNFHRVTAPLPEGYGDVWTWTAIDSDTKLLIGYEVGDRSAQTAYDFINDLAYRLAHRVQLTTDGHHAYLDAVDKALGATSTTGCW